MLLQPIHYVFLGVTAFATLVWTLVSMGVIKLRDHELYVERERHIHRAVSAIEETYKIMENIPSVNRESIRGHLKNGDINQALEAAQMHHDVYHFFKRY